MPDEGMAHVASEGVNGGGGGGRGPQCDQIGRFFQVIGNIFL